MKELVAVPWCSVDWNGGGGRVAAVFSGIIQVGDTRRQIELCEEHMQRPISALEKLLIDFGDDPDDDEVPPERPPIGKALCPVCGEPKSAGRSAMANHVKRKHPGKNVARRVSTTGSVTYVLTRAKRRTEP